MCVGGAGTPGADQAISLVDAEDVVLRRQMWREMIDFFERLPPALFAIEACASFHYRGRLLRSFGHDARLIPPLLPDQDVIADNASGFAIQATSLSS